MVDVGDMEYDIFTKPGTCITIKVDFLPHNAKTGRILALSLGKKSRVRQGKGKGKGKKKARDNYVCFHLPRCNGKGKSITKNFHTTLWEWHTGPVPIGMQVSLLFFISFSLLRAHSSCVI